MNLPIVYKAQLSAEKGGLFLKKMHFIIECLHLLYLVIDLLTIWQLRLFNSSVFLLFLKAKVILSDLGGPEINLLSLFAESTQRLAQEIFTNECLCKVVLKGKSGRSPKPSDKKHVQLSRGVSSPSVRNPRAATRR